MDRETSDNPQEFQFHYSREERLKHAPKNVQNFYKGKFGFSEGGLIRVLLSNKSSKLLFLTIVVVAALGIGISIVDSTDNVNKKNGVKYSLNAFSFDDTVYVSLKIDEVKGYASKDDISITFMALDSTGTVVHQTFQQGIYDGNESFFRTTFSDYDIIQVEALLKNGSVSIPLSSYVERQ